MKPIVKTLTPHLTLSTALVISALLVWITILLATSTPWMGIQLTVDEKNNQVVVDHVFQDGPSSNKVNRGDKLIAMSSDNHPDLAIDAISIIEEPDMISEYADYNHFMQLQTNMNHILLQQSITLITDKGRFTINPQDRPLWALPFVFWFQIICGLIAFLTGISVLVFRPTDIASQCYALNGFSFLMITFTAAIYSGRELAMDGEIFRVLSVLDHLGAMIFAGAFVSLLWLYPTKLGTIRFVYCIISLYFIIWVLDTFQWLPNTDWGIRLPIIIGLILSIFFAFKQWGLSKHKPLERAALKWFLFSLYLGGATFVVAIFVTVWLGLPPPLSQGYAFGVVTIMYLGIAVGITRYRLFNLEKWWFKVWIWFFAGVLIIAIDMVFVYILQFTHQLALGLSLAMAGWLYFPIRQWFFSRIMPNKEIRLEKIFPQLLSFGLNAGKPEKLHNEWNRLLKETFHPLEVKAVDVEIDSPQLILNGQNMLVPGITGLTGLVLSFPDNGKRLFTHDDENLVKGIWNLAHMTVEDHMLYEKGAINERIRIGRDLHDDLGAKILRLIHNSPDEQFRRIAKEAMVDLRDALNNLDEKPARLATLIAEIRNESETRLQEQNVNVIWNDNIEIDASTLSARHVTNIKRSVREIITNALKHSSPRNIEFHITLLGNNLSITITQDGFIGDPGAWQEGRGRRHLQTRLEEIGGTIIQLFQNNNLIIKIDIKLI